MLRRCLRTEIDTKKWDELCLSTPSSSIYTKSWFLDALNPNWEALIDDKRNTAFPFFSKKDMGKRIVYQPQYAQKFDFLHSTETCPDPKDVLKNLERSFGYFQIHVNFLPRDITSSYLVEQRKCQVLDLSKISKPRYPKGLRYSLRKALRINLTVTNQLSPTDFLRFVEDSQLYWRFRSYSKAHNTLVRLLEASSALQISDLWGIYSENRELLCAAFCIKDLDRYYILMQWSNSMGRSHCAGHYLTEEIIKSQSNSVKYLDFAGSNIEGIEFFNKQFGAKDDTYYSITYGRPSSVSKIKAKLRRRL
jgi:hypothetical protein